MIGDAITMTVFESGAKGAVMWGPVLDLSGIKRTEMIRFLDRHTEAPKQTVYGWLSIFAGVTRYVVRVVYPIWAELATMHLRSKHEFVSATQLSELLAQLKELKKVTA